MPPNFKEPTIVQECTEATTHQLQGLDSTNHYEALLPKSEPAFMAPLRQLERLAGFKTPLIYLNIIFFAILHGLTAGVAVYNIVTLTLPMWQSWVFGITVGHLAAFGVTAGAHRLWSHRSYKARWPLQALLVVLYSAAGQNPIFEWVRDHRVHHRHSESAADPHDAHRGFFFAHLGWLMMKKHPNVISEGRKVDMSDIQMNPVIQFHTRHFALFQLTFCFALPGLVPRYCWGEAWSVAAMSVLLRWLVTLHATWAVNSVAHLYGNKPYDRSIMPVQNWGVSIMAQGEGWHNYHHTFPWDHKAAELPYSVNNTTAFLHFFAALGWAYDLKEATPDMIRSVRERKGEKAGF